MDNGIGVDEAMRIINEEYGQGVTRLTVYNWIKVGKAGKKIRSVTHTASRRTYYVTTREWVEEFLRDMGAQRTHPRPDDGLPQSEVVQKRVGGPPRYSVGS